MILSMLSSTRSGERTATVTMPTVEVIAIRLVLRILSGPANQVWLTCGGIADIYELANRLTCELIIMTKGCPADRRE